MGCWGITAFESDPGLDAVDFIRNSLPEDGKAELDKIIEALKQDAWNAPPKVEDHASHTSPMALAELIVKFVDQDISGLDYDEEWRVEGTQFSDIISFTASKESVRWLRDYISDTLRFSRENAEFKTPNGVKWGGWFKEKDWIGWQEHMENLLSRLDMLLATQENRFDLRSLSAQELHEETEPFSLKIT